MKNLKISALVVIGIVIGSIISCSNNESSNTTTAATDVPAVYKKIYGATSITSDGTYIYIKTKDLPDHKSAYYPTTNSLYEAYSGTTFGGNTFVKNPNSIIYFPQNLKHFFKNIFVINGSFSVAELGKLLIPMLFFYLVFGILKNLFFKNILIRNKK